MSGTHGIPLHLWPYVRRALGRRGMIAAIVAIVAPLLRTLVDLATAALLIVFLRALELTLPEMPWWIPASLANASAVTIWSLLLVMMLSQGVLAIAGNQAKISVSEGAHLRMRAALGRAVIPGQGEPLALSRAAHLAGEVLPRATEFFFFGIQAIVLVSQALILATAILWLAPAEALVGFAGIVIGAVLVVRFTRRAGAAGEVMRASHLGLEETKARAAASWPFIRAARLQQMERARYVDSATALHDAALRSYLYSNLGYAISPLLGALVLAATALLRTSVTHTPVGAFVAFLYLFVRFQILLGHASGLVGTLFTSLPQVRTASEFLAGMRNDATEPSEDAGHAAPAVRCSPPAITARDLRAGYGGRTVFDGLDFDLPPGAQLAIAGPNGTGKSTLLSLILGFAEPDEGTLLINGEPAVTWSARNAASIGYLGAEASLHAGTVRANLVYGLPEPVADEELAALLMRLGFRSSRDVLDRETGSRSEQLSAGERQKIGLARALLRRPALLIVDEPTANVDRETEAEITAMLERLRGECTVVVVSHESRVLQHADVTLRLPVDAMAKIRAN